MFSITSSFSDSPKTGVGHQKKQSTLLIFFLSHQVEIVVAQKCDTHQPDWEGHHYKPLTI